MKVRIEFDVYTSDPVDLLKKLQYHCAEDGEVVCMLEELLDSPVWDFGVEVLEFVPEPDEPNDELLAQQELEDFEGLSGFSDPDIERS